MIKNKINPILLIGQFSCPITGEYSCNLFVKEILESNGLDFVIVDSNLLIVASDVGKYSFKKLYNALRIINVSIIALCKSSVLYAVPGQSLFGMLRCIPVLIFAKFRKVPIVLHWHGYGVLHVGFKYLFLLKFIFFLSDINILLTYDLLFKLSRSIVLFS